MIGYGIAFLFGSVVGSFLNVCIHRLPLDQSVVSPASRCPACGAPIRPFDNVPILSYLVLRGRCRDCRAGISLRYPMIELLNGLLYVAAIWRFGLHWHTLFYMLFISAMIVITFIDLDHQIIPDSITLPGIVAGIVFGTFLLVDPYDRMRGLGVINSLIGMLAGGGVFYLIAVVSRGGMGGGDIKMMGMMGAVLGWKGVFMTTFAASLIGSVIGIALMIFKGKGRKTKIPFGPFLAFGGLVSLFFGQEILRMYLHG